MNELRRSIHLRLALAVSGIAFVPQAMAAAAVATPHASACSAAEYRQLEYWIGDWDTFESDAPNGASVARARVDYVAQGCAIHELYEQNDGLIGDSILSYDPVLKKWQQTWVTNRGSFMFLLGTVKDGAMVLEGDVHLKDGSSVKQRITWHAMDNGVRESAVLSKDGGKTWAPAFDVQFRKRVEKSE